MFKFLKEKLKGAISKISKNVEDDIKEEEPKEETHTKKEEKPIEPLSIEEKQDVQEKDEPDIPQVDKKEPEEEEIKEEKKEDPEKTLEELESKIPKEETPEEKPIEKTYPEQISEPEIKTEGQIKTESTPEEIEKAEPQKEAEIKTTEKETIIEKTEPKEEVTKKKEGFFSKLTEKIVTTKISYEKFENIFSELEVILLENNVAMEVIDKIKDDLSKNLVEKPIKRTKIEETIKDSLKTSIEGLFDIERINLPRTINNKLEKPYVIAFFGINGSGKTTTIAKVASLLKEKNISCVLAAADTFRAASIEQLQHHSDKLGLKIIKQDYGSDPAAVAFDAIKHAKSKNMDAVLIDTAGRLHSNINLMDELKKVVKVAKPDLKVFVGESIAGNDCIEQAKKFNEVVGVDSIILTKSDIDEKGGAAISVGYITQSPIIYLGIGQEYNDLKEFDSNLIVESLGL